MTDSQLRLGWLGTGRMGHAMVSRLLTAGHRVLIWNRTPEKAVDLKDLGAELGATPAELATCDVVFSSLADDVALEQTLFGPDGLLTTEDRTVATVVDLTTLEPAAGQRIRESVEALGVQLLSTPVSGNNAAVAAGRLVVGASGPRATYETILPYLQTLGQGVYYLGEGDIARLIKVAHNLMLGVMTQALSEITVMAEKGGVRRADLHDFLNASVVGSTFSRYKAPAFVGLDMTPTMTAKLMRKDFDAGLAAARALECPMPVAALVSQLIGATVAEGMDDQDFAVLLLSQARSAGVSLKPEENRSGTGL